MRRYARVVISVPVRKLAVVAAVLAARSPSPPAAGAATVRNYDLGVVNLPDPGPKGPLPVRLWGAIGVPSGARPASARHRRPRPPRRQLPADRPGDGIQVALLRPRGTQRPRAQARRQGPRQPRRRGDLARPQRRLHDRLGRADRRAALAADRQPHALRGRGGRRGRRQPVRAAARRPHQPAAAGDARPLPQRPQRGAAAPAPGAIDSMLLLAPIHEGVPLRDIPTRDRPLTLRRRRRRPGPALLQAGARREPRQAGLPDQARGREPQLLQPPPRRAGARRRHLRRRPGLPQAATGCAPERSSAGSTGSQPTSSPPPSTAPTRPGWMRRAGPRRGSLHGLRVAIERLFP